MPRHRVMKRRSHRSRMGGSGVLDWLRKAHDFIKKNKLVSRIGSSLGAMGVPYAGAIGKAGGVLGYGRRRVHRRRLGGSLRPAGGARRY